MRALILRKTLTSLTASGLVTFRQKVLHADDRVRFFGGSKERAAAYLYPNGSEIVVGGLDKPEKVMSTEYDMVYVQEATELTEPEWESVTTRLRNGVTPMQQIIGDANPSAPTHWLKRRADAGRIRMLESRHEDNPELWDSDAGEWTERGRSYVLGTLESLTGVRYLRLRKGLWAAAEGMVYDGWDAAVHLIPRFDIPRDWPRYWSIDFGFTNPFVWQAWAQDADGRLCRYRELYRTQRLVEDHAKDILSAVGAPGGVWTDKSEPKPRAIICDHDAEDRATLERHLKMATTPAHKAVSPGIQAVASRLKMAGDGKPRLYLMRDSRLEPDRSLAEAGKPTSTEEEIESYVWDTSAGRRKGEEPVKRDDHGMDAMRYLVMQFDRSQAGIRPL